MTDEIFVNIKMKKLVSLDDKSIIPLMIEKYKKGEIIFPTKFRVVNIDASETRLTLHI